MRFVDPKGKKAPKKVAAAATGGFDDKGMPVVIDWHYAMAELSRKNGVPYSAAFWWCHRKDSWLRTLYHSSACDR